MNRYSVMLSNGHELTVEAYNLDAAMNTALAQYPNEYVVAFKALPPEPETDTDE